MAYCRYGKYRRMPPLYYGSYAPRTVAKSYTSSHDCKPTEHDISNFTSENRFKYVEKLIINLHKGSYERDLQRVDLRATFDDWKDNVAAFKAKVHGAIVKYYAELDFVKRYNLDRYPWVKDKDIVALIQILQVRGRAKAAAKLEKLEVEIDGIAAKIAKLESGGRYYREDVITLNAAFDRVRVSLRVENDRGLKRQQTIEKVAAVPFKAAEKSLEFGSNALGVILAIAMILAVPFVIIMFILSLFGVVK